MSVRPPPLFLFATILLVRRHLLAPPYPRLFSQTLLRNPHACDPPLPHAMGFRYSAYLDPPSMALKLLPLVTYGCANCHTHLSLSNYVLLTLYQGITGAAYLMRYVVNVIEGTLERRRMTTGTYEVRDIRCHQCNSLVGWRYVLADSTNQSYKEGKYILEVNMMCTVPGDDC